MGHHRGEEDQGPGRRRLPLAVDVGLDRAFLDDDQLFVLVRVRRMGRAARLERGGVVLELVERRGRRREDARRAPCSVGVSGTDSHVNKADFISRPSLAAVCVATAAPAAMTTAAPSAAVRTIRIDPPRVRAEL